MLVGDFAACEFLFDQVKLRIPPEYQKNVLRREDTQNASARGVVLASLNRGLVRKTKQIYVMETLDYFKPGVDPEYYRISSLDGQDRCRFTWETVVDIGTPVGSNESRRFPMQKLLVVDESLVFEDAIYSGTTVPPPYIVVSGTSSSAAYAMPGINQCALDTPIVGKITTNLTHRKAEIEPEKRNGPHGPYHFIEYDVFFTHVDRKWSVMSVYKEEKVGHTIIDFK